MKCQLCKTPIVQKTRKLKRYCDPCGRRVNAENARKKLRQKVPDGYYVESAKDSGYY